MARNPVFSSCLMQVVVAGQEAYKHKYRGAAATLTRLTCTFAPDASRRRAIHIPLELEAARLSIAHIPPLVCPEPNQTTRRLQNKYRMTNK